MIEPHGGKLVNLVVSDSGRAAAAKKAASTKQLAVSLETVSDLRNIAYGVYSPLEGYLSSRELNSVLDKGRLTNGLAWTIPIVFDLQEQGAAQVNEQETVALVTAEGKPIALFHVLEKYSYDKKRFAESVFATTDDKHPGVRRVYDMGDVLLGGQIELIDDTKDPFPDYNRSPALTREIFESRGWKTVAAFQTRNAPHTGHENMQKLVLALVDGLLIQPVIGKKKAGDFKDEVILKSYDALIENYYPVDRVLLSILPMEMRYAGPKEAIHHAIIRKNYGCTHLIVGRDHAGVGNYYHPEAAIEIFEDYRDLSITPITIRGDFFFCKRCGHLASDRTCPHPDSDHLNFSGTVLRKMLIEGKTPPPELMRTEVFEAQRQFEKPFVE
jgi:sulfate adenylyltransferase